MNTRKLKKQIQKYNIVSFDIFDTLLKRDVYKPTDVFELVQREYSRRFNKTSNFKNARVIAEEQAREESEYREVTLDEIYKEIDISDKNTYKELELEVESSVLHSNLDLKPIFDKCIEQGKTVYIISDMYLPRGFLESILNREGYTGFKAIILSADYRKTKRSGELYKAFLGEYNVKADSVIHIGDSWYADYIGAKKAGVNAIHIPRCVKNSLYLEKPDGKSRFDERTLYGFLNTREAGCRNRDEQLGYEVLGPILYAYSQWIHDQFEDIGSERKKLWFAARDMYLFKEVYELLYGEEQSPEYMYISRRSLRPILTVATGDVGESGNAFPRGECTLGDVIRRMGYEAEDLNSPTVNLSIKVNPRRLSDCPEAIKALSSPMILKKELELAESGAEYLNSHGFSEFDIVFADVGWHGTTQYILQRILQATGSDRKIYGLYLGCLDSTNERIGRENYQAFVFDEDHDSEFAKGILLFESFILALHGSTVQYEIVNDKIWPILGEADNISDFLKSVQTGAMKFVKDFKESIFSSNIVLDSKLCTRAFCKLVVEPKKEELDTIGQMDYDDFGVRKMATPKSMSTYIIHPKLLYYDLKYSPWRIGFLYKLFKIRLPYAKLYTMARKKQRKQT